MTTNDAPRGEAPGSPAKVSDTTKFYEDLTKTADYYAAPDRLLQTLVDSADVGGSAMGTPITLFLHGSAVTGRVISSQSFYRAMAETFREFAVAANDGALPAHDDEFAATTFEETADRINRAIDADHHEFRLHGTTTSRWILSRHMYLEDAHYRLPGVPALHRQHACIRLNQVIGWTLGIDD